MDEKQRMQTLVEMRRKFREDNPELNLTPAGDEQKRAAEERERKAERKERRDALQGTAREHPKTIARMIRKYTGSK